MAVIKTFSSNIKVDYVPTNLRYLIEVRDYRHGVTLGLEMFEALDMAQRIILAVAEADQSAAIGTLGSIAEQIA